MSAMFKYYATELNKTPLRDAASRPKGFKALGWEGEAFTDDEIRLTREWLRSKANSIEGGTSEIQLNIIAKRVLGAAGLRPECNLGFISRSSACHLRLDPTVLCDTRPVPHEAAV